MRRGGRAGPRRPDGLARGGQAGGRDRGRSQRAPPRAAARARPLRNAGACRARDGRAPHDGGGPRALPRRRVDDPRCRARGGRRARRSARARAARTSRGGGLIIAPCTVVTGGRDPQVIEEAAVRVVGAHIAQVGPAGEVARAHKEDTLWPARGRVLMPGFVNTHAHLARHLARGLGLRHPEEWKRYERALSWEDVRAGVDDTAYERRFAAEESRELAGELEKQREGKLRGMVGVQASTLGGIELLI